MRFSAGVLLLAGSALAIDASLDPWDIDPSCNGFENDLKDAFTQSIDLAEAARSSIDFVLQKMPDRNKDTDAAIKWARIASTVNSLFGFMPNFQGGGSTSKATLERLRALYGKTASVLPSSQNDPPKGNSLILSARPNAKPLIVCGDDVFKWYDADQEPAPGLGKVEDQKDFKLRESVGRKPVGAFYHADRWWYKETKMSSPGICIGSREAVISATDDVLIVCPVMLTDAGKARPTPRDIKATISAQADFMKIFVSTPSVIFHELMHWFGGVNNVNGRLEHIIKDQVAVGGDGMLKYKDSTVEKKFKNKPSAAELNAQGLRQQGAYGLDRAMKLAVTRQGNPWCGPGRATYNADSLTIFAYMMYLDQFDWSRDGMARDFTRIKQKFKIP